VARKKIVKAFLKHIAHTTVCSSSNKEFHSVGPATEKARRPGVLRLHPDIAGLHMSEWQVGNVDDTGNFRDW